MTPVARGAQEPRDGMQPLQQLKRLLLQLALALLRGPVCDCLHEARDFGQREAGVAELGERHHEGDHRQLASQVRHAPHGLASVPEEDFAVALFEKA